MYVCIYIYIVSVCVEMTDCILHSAFYTHTYKQTNTCIHADLLFGGFKSSIRASTRAMRARTLSPRAILPRRSSTDDLIRPTRRSGLGEVEESDSVDPRLMALPGSSTQHLTSNSFSIGDAGPSSPCKSPKSVFASSSASPARSGFYTSPVFTSQPTAAEGEAQELDKFSLPVHDSGLMSKTPRGGDTTANAYSYVEKPAKAEPELETKMAVSQESSFTRLSEIDMDTTDAPSIPIQAGDAIKINYTLGISGREYLHIEGKRK
jgi:hypothetical protein